jgi:mannose-1-phosphate guanylyltransferase/phosphomannomutase
LAGLLPQLGIDTVTIDSGPPDRGSGAFAGADFERIGTVVRSLGSDLGVVIHPHAEKFSLLDEQGSQLGPIELQRLIGFLYFALKPAGIVATPITGSSMLEEYAAVGGGHVRRVRGDHQAMMEAADAGADLVIGTRGGFVSRSFGPGADAMFGCVYAMQLLAHYGQTLSEVRRRVGGRPYGTRSAHCPWEKRGQVMRRLVEWSRSQQSDLRDGVRVFEAEGWHWTGPDPFLSQFNLVAEGTHQEFVDQRLDSQAAQIARWQEEPAS